MYKIGKVEIDWRSRKNGAFTITINKNRKMFRISKKTSRKDVFARIREWSKDVGGEQKVCKHCKKHYAGVHTHNSLCPECMKKAGQIAREGVGHIAELSFSEALQCIPDGVNPVEWEQKLDTEIRAERQALVDLLKEDDQWHNLYYWGKRYDVQEELKWAKNLQL